MSPRTLIRAGMLAILAAASSPADAADDGKCFADWSVAAPMVKEQGLTSVEQLRSLARTEVSGDVVKTILCRLQDDFIYRLVVRERGGQMRTLNVDARKPFGRANDK